jgi:hypothetical protein
MSQDTGTIRPRRRHRIDAADGETAMGRSEHSTRVLIRVPMISAEVKASAPQSTRAAKTSSGVPVSPRASQSDTAAIGSSKTVGIEQGSAAIERRQIESAPSAKPVSQDSNVPADSTPRWRIDNAHTAAPAIHSASPAKTGNAGWLINVVARKSVLAVVLIVAATAIAATVMTLGNHSHQNISPAEAVHNGDSTSHPAKEAYQHPALPAPPRASSQNGPLLPAAVLSTTMNSASTGVQDSNAMAAANAPAAISQVAAPNFTVDAGKKPNAINSQSPLMADYHAPLPAVPPSNDPTSFQNAPGSAVASGTGPAMAPPIYAARRETFSAGAQNDVRMNGGQPAMAAFDGGIGRPVEQTPR